MTSHSPKATSLSVQTDNCNIKLVMDWGPGYTRMTFPLTKGSYEVHANAYTYSTNNCCLLLILRRELLINPVHLKVKTQLVKPAARDRNPLLPTRPLRSPAWSNPRHETGIPSTSGGLTCPPLAPGRTRTKRPGTGWT